MDLKLKNKRALVFGSSSGLGKAIAESLIKEGAQVALCARSKERLEQTRKEIGAALAFPCDLSKPGAATELVEKVIREWSGLDILVCNTGGPPKGTFSEVSMNQWQEGFQSLWLSTVEAMQAALPAMKKQNWGRILIVTSVTSKEPMPALTISNGLRAGLLGLINSASREYGAYNITMNALLPGYTETDRLKELQIPPEKMTSQVPMGRLGRPEELGALATFLASDLAGYVTGQAVACDGGYLHSI